MSPCGNFIAALVTSGYRESRFARRSARKMAD
jgi:hypothetical protein